MLKEAEDGKGTATLYKKSISCVTRYQGRSHSSD